MSNVLKLKLTCYYFLLHIYYLLITTIFYLLECTEIFPEATFIVLWLWCGLAKNAKIDLWKYENIYQKSLNTKALLLLMVG